MSRTDETPAAAAAAPAKPGMMQTAIASQAGESDCEIVLSTCGEPPQRETIPELAPEVRGAEARKDEADALPVGEVPEGEDGQIPGWLPPGAPYRPLPRSARDMIYGLWQTGGQPILCARRMGCSPRLVVNHIQARRHHWEEANFSRNEMFELCALMLRQAIQRMERWAVTMVGKTAWGLEALAPIPEPEHQWLEAEPTPPVQELIPQVLEGLLDERHSIFLQCATRTGGHPDEDGPDRLAGTVDAGPAPHGD